MNEVEEQDRWQKSKRDRFLAPFYREHSREGRVTFLDGASPIIKILQRTLHADTLVNRASTGEALAIEEKIRRRVYPDYLFETESCTVAGHESLGWLYTSAAEILLYCKMGDDGSWMECTPFPFAAARKWFEANRARCREQMVENKINGYALWTRNYVVPSLAIRQALKIEGFILRDSGVVEDFFGRPRMDWLA